MLKDRLHSKEQACEELETRLKSSESENSQLKSQVQTLQSDLRKALSERDAAISERYQNAGNRGLSAQGYEDFALLLATSKMQQAQLKSDLENLKDDLGSTSELVQVRDREIASLSREIEKLSKQNSALSGKTLATSRNVTPVKETPALRPVAGMEKGGIKPFPGLFGLGRSLVAPSRPVKAGTEHKAPASVNTSVVGGQAPSKRSLNSSHLSESKASVKCE